VQAAGFQRLEDKREDLRQGLSGHVQQARTRPNGIINLNGIKLIKAHNADGSAKTFLGLSGDFRRTVRWIDLEPGSDHRFGISPSAAPKLQNARFRRE
jgi:hypothetical protein